MRGVLWRAPPTFGFKVSYRFDKGKFTLFNSYLFYGKCTFNSNNTNMKQL